MNYTREDLLKKVQDDCNDMQSFYKSDFVNYRGKTDKGEKYTEIVAEYLLNHFDLFDNIKMISREKGYAVDTHDGKTKNASSNREEERIALEMFNEKKCYDYIGKIIDYQTPLKNIRSNAGLGKIDLLAANDNYVTILELKKEDSKETLLRCVLEAYTYIKTVNADKLMGDFELQNYKLRSAAFVFKNKEQHNEYQSDSVFTKELMAKLDIGIYIISKSSNGYVVEMA